MVGDGGVDGGELLQTSHAPEAEHRPLPSSERQVRVFGPIVEPAAGLLPVLDKEILQSCAVGAQLVRDVALGPTVLLHCFLEEFQSGLLIAGLGDEAFQHLSLVIDGAPKVVPLPVYLHEHLVMVPPPAAGFHTVDPALADLGGEHRAEAMPPEPEGLMADVDAALMEQILDVPERQREPYVKHHGQADNLRARLEVAERAAFLHGKRLPAALPRLKPSSSDRARAPLSAGSAVPPAESRQGCSQGSQRPRRVRSRGRPAVATPSRLPSRAPNSGPGAKARVHRGYPFPSRPRPGAFRNLVLWIRGGGTAQRSRQWSACDGWQAPRNRPPHREERRRPRRARQLCRPR